MEKTVNNVEQFVKIKRIANVDEDGVINLEMVDGSTFGVAFKQFMGQTAKSWMNNVQ